MMTDEGHNQFFLISSSPSHPTWFAELWHLIQGVPFVYSVGGLVGKKASISNPIKSK